MGETDLFGHDDPRQSRGLAAGHHSKQQSLFGDGDDRIPHPETASHLPKPEDIRAKLQLVLSKARSADRMPWDERRARMWQTVFPQMANWLPEEERDQLCFEFAQEMERLKAA